MPFNFKKTDIADLILIEPKVFSDERGFFAEIYKYSDFEKFGIAKPLVQLNHSKSSRGVLRGLHYQKIAAAQAKLVRVLSGEIFDVALDIRKGSPSYGKWLGVNLSSSNMKMFYIPEGFAHGFCIISDNAEVEYLCSNIYSPELDRGIIWNDPALKIDWPVSNPSVSEKDSKFPVLDKADNDFIYFSGNCKAASR